VTINDHGGSSVRADPRVRSGRLRELGPLNWVVWRLISVGMRVPDAHLFGTLGRARGLFRGWLYYSAKLMPGGKLSSFEREIMILRIAHLRGSAYEFDYHTRIGRGAGVTPAVRERIRAGAQAPSWNDRERTLLSAVEMLVRDRDIDDATWARLAEHYDPRALIEIVLRFAHYDGLATTVRVLRIPRDWQR
jgi:alkylhydroperoxidase family enzyme